MKTLVCTTPGKLEYVEQKEPEIKPGHSIIKIKRVGICGTDLHAFSGTQPYFKYPRVFGHELSGELINVEDIEGFTVGEAVTFIPYFNCGQCIACMNGKPNCCTRLEVCGVHIDGGMTEYLSVPSYSLVHGNDLPYDKLAMIEPFAIGAHGVQRANIKSGEFVLIVGAGPIGLGTMAFAKIAGAKVIAIDVNAWRLKFCKEKLGVEHIIDASVQDVFDQLNMITDNAFPTVVMDATGNINAINKGLEWLAHGGRYILIGLQKENFTFSHPEFHKREATLMSSRNATRKDFENVFDAIKDGKLDPETFITHRVKFDEADSIFTGWMQSKDRMIKAMVSFGS